MNHLTHEFRNHNGEPRSFQYWEPSAKGYERVVVLIHAFGYHAGQYPQLVAALLAGKCKVYGIDLAGFGRSPGERGAENDVDAHVDDLEAFRRHVDKREGYRETVFIGHSLGALVALAHPLRYPDANVRTVIVGLPLASPLYDEAGGARNGRMVKLDFNRFVGDSHRRGALEGDKLVEPAVSARLLSALQGTALQLLESADQLRDAKLLFLHGEDDQLASLEAVREFFARLPSTSKQLETYPRMRHDPFSERRNSQVTDAIGAWLSETAYQHKV